MFMFNRHAESVVKQRVGRGRCAALLGMALLAIGIAGAAEGGSSVYPAGVETVMPGLMPGPGGTLLENFENFYQANELTGPNGRALMPGFHLRVSAVAPKLIHNWGVHFLGGMLVSTGAVPYLNVHLDAPFGSGDKFGFGNPDLETLVAYSKGSLHWWYGFDAFAPGSNYNKTDLVNVGQHNYATAPAAAFTYLPGHGATEISSRLLYIVDYTDSATNYKTGQEFLWEYDGMRSVTKTLALGFNGYYYQQMTNDMQNGAIYLDGNRGRNIEFGPEIRFHFTHYLMALKYEKDFLTQNRPMGNSFWAQFGIPLGGHE